MIWPIVAGGGLAALYLATQLQRRRAQQAAAEASGLSPVPDLAHLPESLQRTALWALAEGGFESRQMHGIVSRGAHDIDVTAFDLETLRERRGEWAWLPVEPPFRIAGVVSVVVCELDRQYEHVLLKRAGRGDQLADDAASEIATSVTKLAREGLRLARSYPSELPPGLDAAPLAIELPDGWRAYGSAASSGALEVVLKAGFARALVAAGRRDLVVELIDSIVVVYPAARDASGPDALADLTATAIALVEGLLRENPISPRGVESMKSV